MTITPSIDQKMRCAEGFRLLAALFYQPDIELYRETELFDQLNALVQTVAPAAHPLFVNLETILKKSTTEELLVDYSALFVGPNELLAPPYGSVYLDGERLLMGESTMNVLNTYSANGLSIDSEFFNAPDHIAVELEFTYFLLHNEVGALRDNDTEKANSYRVAANKFLQENLVKWVPPFVENISKGAKTEYYPVLGQALLAYVQATLLDGQE